METHGTVHVRWGDVLRRALMMLVRDPHQFGSNVRRVLRRAPAEYRRWHSVSLWQWMIYHEARIAFDRCTWMGVPAFKNPLDAWIYQEILYEVRPDVVIEIGSACGGSTLFLAQLLDVLGNGIVVSVDVNHERFQVQHPRIRLVTGWSSAPTTLATVAALCEGKSVLVIHDGDHRYEQVLADLRAYGALVTAGSYLIVEDGIIDLFSPFDGIGAMEAGPLAAIRDFVREHPQFVVDRSRERYIVTYNPLGYLRKHVDPVAGQKRGEPSGREVR